MSKDIIDDIFEQALNTPKIFKDKSVLFHNYIPEKLLFREEQITGLAYYFSSLLRGQKSSNLFIYGKPGTGKTAVTKYVIKKLLEKARKTNIGIYVSYINCRMAGTEYRVIASMARDVNLNVPFTGLSVTEVLERFKTKILNEKKPILIILDEIDSLVIKYGDDLLYSLTRLSDDNEGVNLMILGISNDVRFKEYLDPRVLSSLSEEEMIFKPYTPSELEAILLDRVPQAFYDGVVSNDVIKLCAAISGAEHGDARKALDLLRVSGEIAEQLKSNKITVEHVNMARERIEKNKIAEIVHSLPLHSKLILAAVFQCVSKDSDHVRSSVVYAKYCELAKLFSERPLSNRRFISLVKELIVLGLLEKRIENFGRRGGRVAMISLAIPMITIEKTLRSDSFLGEVFK